MPLKVKGLEAAITSLSRQHNRMTAAAVTEMREGAKAIVERAQQYVPVDHGDLTEAITVGRLTSTGVQTKIPVMVRLRGRVAKYARWIHEGFYNLGPRSKAKAEALGVLVGPKFLSRAANELFPQIQKSIRAALIRIAR